MEIDAADTVKNNFNGTRQYAESFIIVWLDTALEADDNVTKTIDQLHALSNDVEVFNDSDVCIDYITTLKNERVLFIITNSVHRSIISIIQNLLVVSALYILCPLKVDDYERRSEPIRKIKGLFDNMNELIQQIKSDIRRIENDLTELKTVNTTNISFPFSRNLNKQEYSFMFSQLLKDIFLKFQDNSTSDLADYCRTIYADNAFQLAMIDEFERNYEANKAIWWYTRDTFLYKMVYKALRTQHVETLYNMRTFIRHLHQQLIQFCAIRDNTQSASTLTLYRGQRMSIDEFGKLKNNEGGLLSVSNFLSTSASRQIALIYAGEPDDETVAVILELTVDLNCNSNSCFASIEQFSHFGSTEHEWLFSMGTIFRIRQIKLLDNIWHVYLTLTKDQDEILDKLTIHMTRIIQVERPNPLVPLCRLFARMYRFQKAIELCEENLQSENGWEMKATLYDTFALIHVDEKGYDLVLYYHQQALNTIMEHVNENDPLLASYHNNVAISCSAVNQKEEAVEHYRLAINLELKALQPDYTNIAYSYDSMGHILHYCFKKYEEAMDCYEHALELMLAYLPSNHLDIFYLYESMADTYEEMNLNDKALDMLYKCLDGQQKSLECSPHDLAISYRHIAKIYKKQKKFEEASEMLKKCNELEAARPPSKDLNLENINLEAFINQIFRSE